MGSQLALAGIPTFPATCDDLVTNMDVWGGESTGVDLRDYTNSTLHWIGCHTQDGCASDTFFCNFDQATRTLSFGTTAPDDAMNSLRAVIDPGNALGDTMPTNSSPGCCAANNIFGLCNAPDANNNGVPIDAANALCNALGYDSGSLTWVMNVNACPEVNAITADGSDWTSDWVRSTGYGKTYTCVGFEVPNVISPIPTLSEWGLIAMAGVLGIIGFMVLRRRKVIA